MEFIVSEHAKVRIKERGSSEEEIKKAVKKGNDIKAKKGRKAKELILSYNAEWMGRYYNQKKIIVYYVEEYNRIVVITVKVFYGEWK